jgi:hypothetical protein
MEFIVQRGRPGDLPFWLSPASTLSRRRDAYAFCGDHASESSSDLDEEAAGEARDLQQNISESTEEMMDQGESAVEEAKAEVMEMTDEGDDSR